MAMIGRRRLLAGLPVAVGLAGLLSGCGWEPVYADRETSAGLASLRAIKVNPISERVGQQLETGLRTSFNPDHQPAKQLYVLNITLSKSLYNSGIQSQGLGTRGELHINANYQLTEIATNKVLQSGFVHSSDSFDIQANGYSTVVAQDDAARRDVEEIRREIVARMTLFMEGKDPTAS